MTLSEDDTGLLVRADLDATDPEVQMLSRKYRRGDLDGQMSFAFRVSDQEWSDDYRTRVIKSVALHRGDVSIVTHAANEGTTSVFRGDEATTLEERRMRAENLGERMYGANGRVVRIGDYEPLANPSRSRRAWVAPDWTTAARAEFEALKAGLPVPVARPDALADAKRDYARLLAAARRHGN